MDLKYSLVPLDKAYVFQVLYQSDGLTEFVKTYGPIRTNNGWTIGVDEEPEVNAIHEKIFLRGSNSKKDLNVHKTYGLSSNYERDTIIDAVNKALKQVVEDYKAWKSNRYSVRSNGNPLANVNKIRQTPLFITSYDFIVIE
jgi:hypothetical protein